MNRPLLTIAIPTYNRAPLLRLCLAALAEQLGEAYGDISILVSNNASTDDTRAVVEEYKGRFGQFDYVENPENLGADGNIAQVFRLAQGRFVWVFSDDDILLPGCLNPIVGLLREHDPGHMFLEPTWYLHTAADASVGDGRFVHQVYENALDYLEHVHYWVGFISGNIINKDLVQDLPDLYQFSRTNMIQLGWTLPAIFRGRPGVRVFSPTVLGRAMASVSYSFFATSTVYTMRVLDALVKQQLIPAAARRLIVDKTITQFLPQALQPGQPAFNQEKPFGLTLRAFWSYATFWTSLVPLFVRRLYFPATSKAQAAAKSATTRLVDKLLQVNANAQTQSLTRQLAAFGLNSRLPAAHVLRNPGRIAIGRRFQADDNLRIEVLTQAGSATAEATTPQVVIGDDVTVGTDLHIRCLEQVHIGNQVWLGNRVSISDCAPDRRPAARQLPPGQRPLRPLGPVHIEAWALIEEGVSIFGGVRVGEHAVVLAGSVVTHDVPAHAVVSGNPARVVAAETEPLA